MRKHRTVRVVVGLVLGLIFLAGSALQAAEDKPQPGPGRVVYPKQTEFDFEGQSIEGELKNPSEFYFQRLPEEKFQSLVQSRSQFHREMLRDVILSK